jgi:hypothetical protein
MQLIHRHMAEFSIKSLNILISKQVLASVAAAYSYTVIDQKPLTTSYVSSDAYIRLFIAIYFGERPTRAVSEDISIQL